MLQFLICCLSWHFGYGNQQLMKNSDCDSYYNHYPYYKLLITTSPTTPTTNYYNYYSYY